MDNCKFCEILEHVSVKEVHNTILYENDNFFVIPALGCMVKNYIMIVSKRHVHSMCYLNKQERKDLNDLISQFRMLLKNKYGFFPIVFEHGACKEDTNKSACCILHAHIHIVPLRLNCQEEMLSVLGLSEIKGYKELYALGKEKPYISFFDNSGKMFFRDVLEIAMPSQTIRKWIAKDIGIPSSWDWRENPFNENIIPTIDELKCLIKDANFKKKNQNYRYIYYCRAMDGLPFEEIKNEFATVKEELQKNGMILVNPFDIDNHNRLEINVENADIVINENKKNISQADCVVVNISIPKHLYIGCIGEMIYAKTKGCFVITIVGDTGADKHFYTLYHSDKIVKTLDEAYAILKREK